MSTNSKPNQLLMQIEGCKPFLICRFCTVRENRERIFDHLEIREVVPLSVIQITTEMLQIAIDDCIENESELNSYDEQYECELPLHFCRDQDLTAIWQKIEPKLVKYQRDFTQMETQEEVQEYLSDYLWDNCLDLLQQEPYEKPFNRFELNVCHCADYPCCGHSR